MKKVKKSSQSHDLTLKHDFRRKFGPLIRKILFFS
jgi:hypothetical protein